MKDENGVVSPENHRRVLVPGSGLSRLLMEVVERGYGGQGNEFSYQMLLVSNYMLNHVFEEKSVGACTPPSPLDHDLSVDGLHQQRLFHGRQQPSDPDPGRGSVPLHPGRQRLLDVRRRVRGELRGAGERVGLRADVLLRGHGAGGVRVRVVMGRDGQVRGTDSQDPEAGRLLDQPGSVAVSLAGGEERCG